jgi:hypothetical protein
VNKLEVRFDRITRTIITDIFVRRTTKPGSFVSGAPVVDIPNNVIFPIIRAAEWGGHQFGENGLYV